MSPIIRTIPSNKEDKMKKSSQRLYFLLPLMLILSAMLALTACSSHTTATPTATATPIPTTTTASTPTPTTASYTVNIASKTGIGDYLVDGKGMTLYYFTKDAPGKSNATAAIIANWPIFYASNIVVPPSLNATDFGSITGANGNMQSTYKGWPLYNYIKDQAPGDTMGQDLNGVWFVINPASFPPTSTPAPTTTSTLTPATTTAPTSTSTPTPTPTSAQSVTINLTAQNMSFDQKTITVPAGASVTINFTNKDSIPHNFALYTDSTASHSIFVGKIITSSSITYTFTAPTTPGNYFFRCDVHPSIMTGTFVVQ